MRGDSCRSCARRGNVAARRSQRTLDVLPLEFCDEAALRILKAVAVSDWLLGFRPIPVHARGSTVMQVREEWQIARLDRAPQL